MTIRHVDEFANAVRTLIYFAGDRAERPGLEDTPNRVYESHKKLFSGYNWTDEDIQKMLTLFDEPCDEMVVLANIEFYSTCEHHLLPFIGTAHIAYIPDSNRVCGISKLARLLDVYARRLQIQERIGQQVTDALMKHLMPKGAACILEAKHLCISCRGVEKQQSVMITSSMQGCFRTDINTRTEFLRLIGK